MTSPDQLRAFDRRCAEALGWPPETVSWTEMSDGFDANEPPRYSSDPAACAILKKRLQDRGVTFIVAYLRDGTVATIVGKNITFTGEEIQLPQELDSHDTEEEAVARLFIGAHEAGLLKKFLCCVCQDRVVGFNPCPSCGRRRDS